MTATLQITLVDGSRHEVVLERDVDPEDALAAFLRGGGSFVQQPGWVKTHNGTYVRLDSIISARLEGAGAK